MSTPSEELVAVPAPDAEPVAERTGSWWQRLDKKLLAASAVIASGLVLIVVGLASSVTGDERSNRPAAVEEVTPVFGAIQVPQQTSIVADLEAGYVGYLIVDGVELPTVRLDDFGSQDVEPGEQVEFPPGARFEPGNATLTFTPGGDQPVESFDAGLHTVQVVFWKEIEGPGTARSYTWTFTVV